MKKIDITGTNTTSIINIEEADCLISGTLNGIVSINATQFVTLKDIKIISGLLRISANMITVGPMISSPSQEGTLHLVAECITCPMPEYPEIETDIKIKSRQGISDQERIDLSKCAASYIELDKYGSAQIYSESPVKIKR